ncbi:MAG TPA: hypothetical protein ENJ82_14265 [Bacteroidetes bacterium]|nr:hypothetical protein [Bacteroidota bacterium]
MKISFLARIMLIALLLAGIFSGCAPDMDGPMANTIASGTVNVTEKVNGVAFVSPSNPIGDAEIGYISNSNAGWIQLIPYAFSRTGEPQVHYNWSSQWWGETVEGTRAMIRSAHNQGLKVLIKPHIWVLGQGWAGDYTLTNEADWEIWEAEYQAYIMIFAQLAAEENVEMIAVGTELKKIVQNRADYFGRLADSVRVKFDGAVTYAANWDNYEQVQFWDKMDYIGVDAYFPLVEADTPEVDDLITAWKSHKAMLRNYSKRYQLPVLFLEWGYLSVNNCGWRNWELEANLQNQPLNMQAQTNCFAAIFQTFWEENWFAGGFVWQWYANHPNAGGINNREHTPQNKPAFSILSDWYGR